MSAYNYALSIAMSIPGGGQPSLSIPPCPAAQQAPAMASPFGPGVAAPVLWTIVEAFVGEVWPDGNPASLRAASGAWTTYGGAPAGPEPPQRAAITSEHPDGPAPPTQPGMPAAEVKPTPAQPGPPVEHPGGHEPAQPTRPSYTEPAPAASHPPTEPVHTPAAEPAPTSHAPSEPMSAPLTEPAPRCTQSRGVS
ncbi:hypothetical protein [Mycobacterium sp. ML3]